jgi:hypothetical protein
MSVLDNIMSGRNLKMKTGLLAQALRNPWFGSAEKEEIEHREFVERIIDFLEIQAYRKTPVGRLPYGLQKRVDLGRSGLRWLRQHDSGHARRAEFTGRRRAGHPLAQRARRRHQRDRLERHLGQQHP